LGVRRTDGERRKVLMVAYVFDRLLTRAARQGITPSAKRSSRNWFRTTARRTATNPGRLIGSDSERLTTRPLIGRMYLFQYDPKGKKTLPYYDRYPLIFPIGSTASQGQAMRAGSFMGLNLHYLPPVLRARLMDSLYETANNDKMDDSTRLRISYNILNQVSRYRFFRPCLKRYLISHVRTKFFYIEPNEWDMALFLPIDRFVGSNINAIYRDSRNRIA